ncbi:hypothetical protein CB0101_14025 [Synechococcus sp. CB0101]|uniref:hypothetical protein n=1 Tax=Synechococcus sp. CB0101 TaxID=232348 RepID=UPI0010AA1FB2|nr:hypothetical protein [Synechococcus sp. CB0101]QCH15869.1 hypothetical protein CB0101_14025 [Synechococcus sp. CB0101]
MTIETVTTVTDKNTFDLSDADLQGVVGGRRDRSAQRKARKAQRQIRSMQPTISLDGGVVTIDGVSTGGPGPAPFNHFEPIPEADRITFPQMPG